MSIDRFHAVRSSFVELFQVFLGRPLSMLSSTTIVWPWLVQDVLLCTCPAQRILCWLGRVLTSCMPSFSYREAVLKMYLAFKLQIHLIIALSVLSRLDRSELLRAQHSAAYSTYCTNMVSPRYKRCQHNQAGYPQHSPAGKEDCRWVWLYLGSGYIWMTSHSTACL